MSKNDRIRREVQIKLHDSVIQLMLPRLMQKELFQVGIIDDNK